MLPMQIVWNLALHLALVESNSFSERAEVLVGAIELEFLEL